MLPKLILLWWSVSCYCLPWDFSEPYVWNDTLLELRRKKSSDTETSKLVVKKSCYHDYIITSYLAKEFKINSCLHSYSAYSMCLNVIFIWLRTPDKSAKTYKFQFCSFDRKMCLYGTIIDWVLSWHWVLISVLHDHNLTNVNWFPMLPQSMVPCWWGLGLSLRRGPWCVKGWAPWSLSSFP